MLALYFKTADGRDASYTEVTPTNPLPVSATVSTTGLATSAKQDDLLTALTTPATELPKTPLMPTSDLANSFNSSSASTTRELVAATASQTTRVHQIVASAAGATTLEFKDGSGGTTLFTLEFPAAGAYVLDFTERPYLKTSANTALHVISSNAVKTTVTVRRITSA